LKAQDTEDCDKDYKNSTNHYVKSHITNIITKVVTAHWMSLRGILSLSKDDAAIPLLIEIAEPVLSSPKDPLLAMTNFWMPSLHTLLYLIKYFYNIEMTTPITFLRQTYDELGKVKWPTRNETIRLTTVVLIISFVIGLYIGGVDFLLTRLIGILLR